MKAIVYLELKDSWNSLIGTVEKEIRRNEKTPSQETKRTTNVRSVCK